MMKPIAIITGIANRIDSGTDQSMIAVAAFSPNQAST